MSRILPDFIIVKTTNFQLVFNFEQTRTVTIFREHGIMPHTTMAKPVRALELHNYPMIKFFKMTVIVFNLHTSFLVLEI